MTSPKSRTLTSSSTLLGSPKEKKPVRSVRGIARPTPLEPSNWFCHSTCTRNRFFCRHRVVALATHLLVPPLLPDP